MSSSEENSEESDNKNHKKLDHLQNPTKHTKQNYFLTKQNNIAIIVVILAGVIAIATNFKKCFECLSTVDILENQLESELSSTKIFWAFGKSIESGYLHNVFHILDRMGYVNDPNSTDWDLLWAHDYPFRILESKLKNLKPHQKVNKLPGSGYITNKVDLVTSNLRYIPPAFRLPKEKDRLLIHSSKNPEVQFVQKSNDHRNIYIKKINEIDLDKEGTFVQEFVDKPYLVSGHKFDIGIYTIVTSVDPLRVYIYNGDALLRFCPIKYYPFDPNITDKYVVGDDYLPVWNVPGLKTYYNTLGFGMKESLNAYVRSENKDPSIIWDQIEDSIRTVFLDKEELLINSANRYKSKRNFFEMMRFDFVVDENLQVFLMEANMSPNLSSAHFPPNKLLFEQVIFNLFALVGISERVEKDLAGYKSTIEEKMYVADKNIAVFARKCDSSLCRASCISPICQLCRSCLSSQTRSTLMQAYLEHLNKGACKRIFPPSMSLENINSDDDLDQYSAENQLQYRWFQGKCEMDPSWCV